MIVRRQRRFWVSLTGILLLMLSLTAGFFRSVVVQHVQGLTSLTAMTPKTTTTATTRTRATMLLLGDPRQRSTKFRTVGSQQPYFHLRPYYYYQQQQQQSRLFVSSIDSPAVVSSSTSSSRDEERGDDKDDDTAAALVFLRELNPSQRQAVTQPLQIPVQQQYPSDPTVTDSTKSSMVVTRVIAGPGSGKTKGNRQ